MANSIRERSRDDSHCARPTLITAECIFASGLLEQSKDAPAELRRKVTTPKGTTQAALEAMEAGDLGGMMRRAVEAAARRAKEMGK